MRAATVSLVFAVAFVACTSSERTVSEAPSFDGADAGPPPPNACGRRCSRDLHAIVDGCTGAVVETCGADSGCSAGACVAACEAAARSEGSIGCSFWTTPPDVLAPYETSCFAAFVANTWSTPVTVRAALGKAPLDVSRSIYRAKLTGSTITYDRIDGPIPPGEVGIVFLSQGQDNLNSNPGNGAIRCPAGVEVAHDGVAVAAHATSVYDAFHLETDQPVSAYSIFPYGGARSLTPSATLLLPSSSWRTSYVLLDGWGANVIDNPFVQIVAGEDDTEVRIRPGVDVRDGAGVEGAGRGSVGTWRLGKGQVLEFLQPESLAGSPLESSKPVAVFGGSRCVNLPAEITACDSLQQQVSPVSQWSTRYSGVPYASRRTVVGASAPNERVYWRVAAARDGTVLTYDPERPGGAPAALNAGEHVTFDTEARFTVKSQDAEHPIHLSLYMSGSALYETLGDPDFVNVVPDDQFLDHYVFFVDFTFADSSLTFVRRKDEQGFHDVTLACAGTIGGWQPLGDGTVEYAFVDLTKSRRGVGACTYGRNEASSDGPFGLYVFGMDDDASYGYPAGAGSRPTSPVNVIVR